MLTCPKQRLKYDALRTVEYAPRSAEKEDGVAGGDLQQLPVRGVRADAVEEHADLELPALEVGPEDVRLVLVGHLGGGEDLHPAAEVQFAAARDAHVADTLGVATWRDEVALALVHAQVERRGAPLAALAPADVEDARAEQTDPPAVQRGDQPATDAVQDVVALDDPEFSGGHGASFRL